MPKATQLVSCRARIPTRFRKDKALLLSLAHCLLRGGWASLPGTGAQNRAEKQQPLQALLGERADRGASLPRFLSCAWQTLPQEAGRQAVGHSPATCTVRAFMLVLQRHVAGTVPVSACPDRQAQAACTGPSPC